MPQTFDQLFLELLCHLYKWLGGDCAELGSVPTDAITVVQDQYDETGPPEFSSPSQKEQFIAVLDNIDAALALPGNTLDPDDTQRMSDLIEQIRTDINA
jgi:hypothetical protein